MKNSLTLLLFFEKYKVDTLSSISDIKPYESYTFGRVH